MSEGLAKRRGGIIPRLLEPGAGSPVLGSGGERGWRSPSPGTVAPMVALGVRVCVCSVCAGLAFLFFEGEMGVGLEETFCMSYLVDWILIFYALAVTTLA